MAFILTADQEVSVAVAFVDDYGNPATVDGAPKWTTSDDTIFSVVAADDGMSAMVSAVGPVGQGQVSVTADADLGDGIVELIGLMDIQIVAGDAVSAMLTPGSPSMKGAAPPVVEPEPPVVEPEPPVVEPEPPVVEPEPPVVEPEPPVDPDAPVVNPLR